MCVNVEGVIAGEGDCGRVGWGCVEEELITEIGLGDIDEAVIY